MTAALQLQPVWLFGKVPRSAGSKYICRRSICTLQALSLLSPFRRHLHLSTTGSSRLGTVGVAAMAAGTQLASWQEVAKGEQQRPSLPRSGQVAVALPVGHSHDVLVFGGYTENLLMAREATNEGWLFSASEGKWTPIAFCGGKIPQARLVSQTSVVGNSLFLIGGWDPGHKKDGGDILSDVWKLDLQTYEWTEVEVQQGETLQPISRHQAVAVGNNIYIHTHRNTEDILVLDTAVTPAALSRLPIASPDGSPTSRGLHSMTVVGSKAYIYGGAPQKGGMLGDLWELDLEQRVWRELDLKGQTPHVRCSHAAAAVGNHIYFFGGSFYKEGGGLQPLHDLFTFDIEEQSWQWPVRAPSDAPRPRNAHSMVALADGWLLLYGGWDPFKQSFNDTFVLDVSSIEWTDHAESEHEL